MRIGAAYFGRLPIRHVGAVNVNGVTRPVTQAVLRGVRRLIPLAHTSGGGIPANPLPALARLILMAWREAA